MALTITALDNGVAGHKRANRGTLALDASYPSGGYPVTARTFGLAVIDFVEFAARRGYTLEYDPASYTVRVYQPNDTTIQGGQQVGDVVQVGAGNILGKTTAGTIISRALGAPVEVAAGTNLSAVSPVPWRAEGV